VDDCQAAKTGEIHTNRSGRFFRCGAGVLH
jgi:hypothetical protein